MKKNILSASILLSLGISTAQAVSINITTMEWYDQNGEPQFYAGGLNTAVDTITNFSSAGNGVADYGTIPFLGTPWVLTQTMWDETTGVATNWSGTVPSYDPNTGPNTFSYDYTLSAGQIAVGLLYNWGVTNTMILQIFDCSNGVDCVGVNNDTVHPNVPGTVIDNGVFSIELIDQHLTFKGVSAVPVPPAVWLFGSGLLGLLGVARRRKAA